MNQEFYLPPEWEKQSGVQLTWPHAGTDWTHMLKEVQGCFTEIAKEIAQREKLLIIAPNIKDVIKQIEKKVNLDNVRFFECETNDTWARDHGGITILDKNGNSQILDFKFNGWGLKFAANLDNLITGKCFQAGLFDSQYSNRLNFVIEGGSIESDGKGTLLTDKRMPFISQPQRRMAKNQIEEYLKNTFGMSQILWLDYGFLQGDDTDSHIDTLARVCPDDTIVYVQCNDPDDIHYDALKKMETQLKSFRTIEGKPFRLLPLPMANEIIFDNERLPATYANFLIINDAILYPTYNQIDNDIQAASILATAFPGYEIIGIDCRALIKQHGSLHCVTMQYPENVLK